MNSNPAFRVDFHMHSTFSDGVKTPEELCEAIGKAGIRSFALTDHDTADGISRMKGAASASGLRFLPGAEISCGNGGHTHLLIYGRVTDPRVKSFLDGIRADRQNRAKQIVALLEKEGIPLDADAVERLSVPNVGRAHIARELIACGAVNTVRQAFDRYLDTGKCCYVSRNLPMVGETIEFLRSLPVVTVLAHPMETGLEQAALMALMEELAGRGLQGVEAFHPSATPEQGRRLEHFARSHGLLVTGGSDYHGDVGSQAKPGHTGHVWKRMNEDTEALFAAAEQ